MTFDLTAEGRKNRKLWKFFRKIFSSLQPQRDDTHTHTHMFIKRMAEQIKNAGFKTKK